MDLKAKIAEAAKAHDSFYLYEEAGILSQAEKLKAAFPSVTFLYSLKCNPNRHILNCVFGQGFGADAASAGEVVLAARAGLPKEQIYYSAPGKSQLEIEKTIGKAILIADSIDEIRRIEEAAAKHRLAVKIGIRINPGFSFGGGAGLPSKFGIDEEQAAAFLKSYASPHVSVTGLHVHLRSQELNAAVLEQYYKNILRMADALQESSGLPLEYLNMGSGLGIPYSGKDTPLEIQKLGETAEREIRKFHAHSPNVRILIETGRYIVGKSGTYVTKVMDRKISCGKTYLIVKNTMNGFFRPSLARLAAQYAGGRPLPASEPLFTAADAFAVSALCEAPPTEEVTIAGNLCTVADVVAENIKMPHLVRGDILTISNAGAYGAVLSPMQFSSQEVPAELFLKKDGSILV